MQKWEKPMKLGIKEELKIYLLHTFLIQQNSLIVPHQRILISQNKTILIQWNDDFDIELVEEL